MPLRYILIFCFIHTSLYAQQRPGITPDFFVVQYAGSIGYFSGGIGYSILNSKARLSGHFGFVPADKGGPINIVSAKLFFVPADFTVWNRVKMNPFDIGVMVSYHYGDNFETDLPEGVHPKGYYWWQPALRTHLAMESSATYEFKKHQRFHSVTAYFECNTNELYFVSFVQNIQTISFWDIVRVGTGVRLYLK